MRKADNDRPSCCHYTNVLTALQSGPVGRSSPVGGQHLHDGLVGALRWAWTCSVIRNPLRVIPARSAAPRRSWSTPLVVSGA